MKPTEIKDKVNDYVLTELEKGVVPRSKSWSSIQVSGTTGKPYHSINQLLLQIKKGNGQYESNRRLTFNTVKKLGGYVKKGEKATTVVYRQILHKEKIVDGKTETLHIPLLKEYRVFNLDQTTLQNLVGSEVTKVATAEQILENFEDKPTIRIGTQPCYIPKIDTVEIPTMNDFKTQDNYYSVLFHELSHSTGSSNRLNRKGITERNQYGDDAYGAEELLAELSSAYLCSFAGIESTKEQSASYLQGWMKAIKADPSMLLKASTEGRKATEYILNSKEKLLEALDSQTETTI